MISNGSPKWKKQPIDQPIDPLTQQSWVECVQRSPGMGLYLHPNLVVANGDAHAEHMTMYVCREEGGDRLRSLAVLAPKTIRLQPVPGVPWRISLQGERLVDDQVAGDNSEEVLRDFIGMLASRMSRGEVDGVLFEDTEVGSPLWNALERVRDARDARDLAVFYPAEPQPHWWVRFPPRPQDFWCHLGGKLRRNIRRETKRLANSSLIRCTDEDQLDAFLTKAHEVSLQTWQSRRRGLRIRNSAEERQFLQRIASVGALRSYLLEQQGRPVAFGLGFQWGGRFIYEETGYDPAYANFHPGKVLLYRVLEDLIDHDTPRLFDCGFGDSWNKRQFCNHQTLSGPVMLVRRSWRPMAAMVLQQCRRRVERQVRGLLQAAGASAALRRVYRRYKGTIELVLCYATLANH